MNRRRDQADLPLHGAHERGKHSIDLIEIGMDSGKLVAGRNGWGGNAQVQIDVRIHGDQELLQNERRAITGRFERDSPTASGLPSRLDLRQGVKIAIGEHDIEPLHQRTVLKSAGGDAVFHALRDTS